MRVSASRTAERSVCEVVVVIGAASEGRAMTGCESALARTMVVAGRGRGIGMASVEAVPLPRASAACLPAFPALLCAAACFAASFLAALATGFLAWVVSGAARRGPPRAIRDATVTNKVGDNFI